MADTLSRSPTSFHDVIIPTVMQEGEVFRLELAQWIWGKKSSRETSKDPVLAVFHKVVLSGWPSERKEVPEQIRVYWDLRDEITLYDGILYKFHEVIVLTSLRTEMLRKIHKVHQGADSSIRRARESVHWPGVQAAIRQKCSSCRVCAQYLSERSREPMSSHDIPFRPWSKVSADLSQLNGRNQFPILGNF